MARRALVIGSQTGGLRGVHGDVEVVADALTSLGFTVTRAIEREATYDGIVERYRGLIDDTASDDAAAVYYSGHGGRQRNPLVESDPAQPQWLQFLVPTDVDDHSNGRFRGLLAQELSLLQLELTERSPNVTSILDCCHSARMSRDPAMLPKADDRRGAFPWDDVGRRLSALRADPRADLAAGDANRLAVRVVACSPDESAYELASTALGGSHGALTSTLVPILTSGQAGALTWRAVLDLVRPAVMDVVPQQRPELEGPANRLLFTTETCDDTGVLPVVVDGGAAVLEGAVLLGMSEGDTYDIVGPSGDRRHPLATAVVERIVGDRARLALRGIALDALPTGASAHPVDVALGARPVAILPLDHPERVRVAAALRGSTHVRVTERPTGVVATVQLDDNGMLVLDAGGQPLGTAPRPVSPGALTLVADDLRKLARATHVRELASGAGPAGLPDEVEVSYARLLPGGGEAELDRSGEHLFGGDRLVIRFGNGSAERRYVSVLDVGVSGAVSVQTASEPAGVTLEPGERYTLGEDLAGRLDGIELFWPDDVPAGAPRPETMVTIVADAKVDGLERLEQTGVRSREAGGVGGEPASSLGRLIRDLDTGRRDARPTEQTVPTRYRVHHLDFVFHAEQRGGEVDEPHFEVDERPDPSFRLVVPRAVGAPSRVAVRLKEVSVHSTRSLLAAAVRLDALVVTVPPEGSGEPYTAATARIDRARDGDRLPFDDLLLFEGPVGRFVDIAIWLGKDDGRQADLADLLVAEASSVDLEGAVATLAGLAAAAPQAAVIAGSAAAVAAVVRTGDRIVAAAQGASVGVYRTSLLPHQRFGAGAAPGRIGRHPVDGFVHAQDMSFAYEVVDLDPS
ncbi:MAG TPA: caspase family protein [Acidimicrobiales bacterium]|nr:caspase family protein [Acidimicrobiales bacterium]